ncbi:MAG: hypothetical protein IBV53_03420 [Candidatus Atribacteria bacterium]
MRRITFIVVLVILLLVITSILLLIWWPTKASLAEITNSWVALIIVYLILIIFLFEKPIYKFYSEFIDIKRSGRHDSQQSKQKEILGLISDSNLSELVSYRDPEWDSILKRENQETASPVLEDKEIVKYIQKLQNENIKWHFLYANNYLVLYAKYVLFWLFKLNLVKREDLDKVWQLKVPDCKERDAILNALLNLEFICVEEDNLFITELGSAYVNYLKELDKHPG